MHSYNEPTGLGLKFAIALAVVVLAAMIGLAIYGSRIQPVLHPVEQVVPNDQLAK